MKKFLRSLMSYTLVMASGLCLVSGMVVLNSKE